MKLDIARWGGQLQDLCIVINNVTPAWLRILFVAACGALVIEDWDRFNAMGRFTNLYITLCAVIAFTTGWLIAHLTWRALKVRRATEGRSSPISP